MFVSDTRRGGTAAFDDVDMSVSAQSLLGPWKARGTLEQKGRPFSIGISTSTYEPGQPFSFTFRFSPVEGPGLVYAFDGQYSALGDEPLTGTLTAEPYVAASGKSDSELKLKALVFKADLGFREDHALLRNIEIAPADREHAGNLLTGNAAIELQERVSVMADLRSPNYDLDAMLGSTGREVLKSGAFLDGLSDFLEVLPGTLDGRVRLDIGNLVVGGAKLEGTRLEAELSESGLIIHELAVTMPGQTKGRLTGRFVSGQEPLLTGDLTVEFANTREFLSWLMPEWRQAVTASWTGARGKLELGARLDHRPQSVKLTDAKVQLDDAQATGSLSMVGGPEAQMSLRLAVDRLDADRYLAKDAKLADLEDDVLPLIGELFRPGAKRHDLQLTVLAGELKLHDTEARDVAVDLAVGNGGITVHAINIGQVGDARLAVTGSLKPAAKSRHGTLTVEVEAQDAEPLLRLLGIVGEPADGVAQPHWAQRLGPVNTRLTGSADIEGQVIRAAIDAQATAGGSSLVAKGDVEADWSDLQAARVKFSAGVVSPDTRTLAQLFAIEGQTDDKDEASLSLQAEGILRDGLRSIAQLTAVGAEASFDGNLTRLSPAIAAEGQLKVDAASADRLLAALGIPTPEPGAPMRFESRLTTGDGRVALDGFTAMIGGKHYEGRLAAGQGRIDVEAKAAELSLPWLLAAALLPRDRADCGRRDPVRA